MPIYEYQCEACGERLEVMQKISDKPLQTCPACKKRRLRKLVSAAAFRLKGSGWYETDFKDRKKSKAAGAGEDKDTAKPTEQAKAGDGKATAGDGGSSKAETGGKGGEKKSGKE